MVGRATQTADGKRRVSPMSLGQMPRDWVGDSLAAVQATQTAGGMGLELRNQRLRDGCSREDLVKLQLSTRGQRGVVLDHFD